MLSRAESSGLTGLFVAVLLAGSTACVGGGHSHGPPPPVPKPSRCPTLTQRPVDLTQLVHPDMPIWPGGVPFTMERLADYPDGYRLHRFSMGENSGTHVDAPSHFVDGKRSIDRLRVDDLVVPIAVIDVSAKVANDEDYAITANDIIDWEAVHGPIPVGSFVAAHTGWSQRWNQPATYVNQDGAGVMHFPGYSGPAAQLLIEREVVGIGIDTLSLDPGSADDFVVHKLMLAANRYQIENLTRLDMLPPVGATVVVGVLPVADGSQAQARVIALVPESLMRETEKDAEEKSPGD